LGSAGVEDLDGLAEGEAGEAPAALEGVVD